MIIVDPGRSGKVARLTGDIPMAFSRMGCHCEAGAFPAVAISDPLGEMATPLEKTPAARDPGTAHQGRCDAFYPGCQAFLRKPWGYSS